MNTKITEIKCTHCGHKLTIKDTPGISYICFCDNCGWESDQDYYINPQNGRFELMTKQEAESIGSFSKCPDCGQDMEIWENKAYCCCLFCASEKNLVTNESVENL